LWNIYNKDFNIVAVTKLASNIALPCLIYDSITRTNLTINIFFKIFTSAFLVLIIGFLFGYIFIKIFKLPSIKLITPIMHPNSGNMGLPLALLTFGNEGLALAAGFASIVMVSHFTANTAISSGNYSVKKILLSPVLLSLIFSLIILFYKIEMPSFINNFFKIFTSAFLVLVLGFLFGYIFIKIFKLPSIKLTTPIMHPNSGNMGLTLALLTFGNEGLSLAAGVASIVMVSHFTANTAISSGNYSVKKILLSPVLLSLIFSLII
jgi:hypothetical protein